MTEQKQLKKILNETLSDVPHQHVHFGAGKLGLGLVIPTFKIKCRIIIIQRISEEWENIKNSDGVCVYVNDKKSIEFSVIYDFPEQRIINEKITSGKHLLVCSNNQEIQKYFLQNANSISTTLGKGLNDPAIVKLGSSG